MNMEMEALRNKLKNKWILLDANVLINASINPKAFAELFEMIKISKCVPVYCALLKAEILQSVYQEELIKAREEFLKLFGIESIPLNNFEQLTNEAINVLRSLRASGKPMPGLVDAYLMALVKRHSPNLFILTENHKDFAYTLKRFSTWTIDYSKSKLLSLGFYEC